MLGRFWLIFALSLPVCAQTTNCPGTPAYSPCEFTFELTAQEAAAHPNPYTDVELRIEFRSPRFRTFLMPAFWDGGRKLIVRFVPTDSGEWVYRMSSNLPAYEGKQGTFQATESDAPGYVKVANVHHWITENKKPHLWMGATIEGFGAMPAAELDARIATIEAQKFNHVRVSILGSGAHQTDRPDIAYFDELDRRLMLLQKRRITADLILAPDPATLVKLFPDWQSRKRFVRYIIGRYGALNITWGGVEEFEGYPNARAILKEIGLLLKELDGYQHPRSTNARLTSSPFLSDGWMDFAIDHSADNQIGSVEHQFFQVPFVAVVKVGQMWNAAMNGQYPTVEGNFKNEPKQWFDFMSDTRHWELEPYFDVDSARCVSLEGVEYILLVEKPGPVEVQVEKHAYDVLWFNPLTGDWLEQKKKYHGEHYTGSAPDNAHPWVLLVAREGRKESMLKSYRFDSRPVPVQEIEQSTLKVPFGISEPGSDDIPVGPVRFGVKLKKESRATRQMMYVWTGEVPADGNGYRVLGTGAVGTMTVPNDIATRYPAVLSVRVNAINANGKAYTADRVFQLSR